jgi:group I intron endonuclease
MKGVIYQIINEKNGKKYIGSTTNPEKRKKRHFRELKNGNHHNVILQRSWEKYNKEKFKFEVLEEVEEGLRKREQELINKGEYNISSEASGGDLIKNHPNKEKIEKRKTEGFRKYIENLSKEQRKNKYGRNGKVNGNWKGGICEEKTTCSCGNDKGWYADKCMECYDKSGENNPFYGKSHSEETKKKLREASKGNKNTRKSVTNGEQTFSSLGKAAKSEDVTAGAIHNRLNSDTFPNWQYA